MARNDIHVTRATNRAAQQRQSAIDNVLERLEVRWVRGDQPTRQDAEVLVDAVVALTKPRHEPIDIHLLADRMRREEGVQ